jgi:hypothetical protein
MNIKRMDDRLLRIVVALIFGFMSLGHGPVMTFAHAGDHSASGGHDSAVSGHHHQTAVSLHDRSAHDDAGQAMPCHEQDLAAGDEEPSASRDPVHHATPCNAFGCFVSVGSPGILAPVLAMRLLGKLKPLPPANFSDAFPEPVDPPPRLHG